MSNIMKKDDGLPSLMMPQLPQIFEKVKPIETPELSFNKGLLRQWYEGKKIRNMAEASENEARIAENRLRVVRANTESMMEAITFGEKVKTAFRRHEHERNMMTFKEQEGEAIVAQQVYKAKIMGIEYQDALLNYRLKLKEAKKELGDDAESQDW